MKRTGKFLILIILIFGFIMGPAALMAAGKPSLTRKKVNISVNEKIKIKVRNIDKNAKVIWKSNRKSVVKIIKKSSKGRKAFAKVKGIKQGKAVIKATIKMGKKTKRLKCRIKVLTATEIVSDAAISTDVKVNTEKTSKDNSVNTSKTKAKPTTKPSNNNQTPISESEKQPDPTAVPPVVTPAPTQKPVPADSLLNNEASGEDVEISFADIFKNS